MSVKDRNLKNDKTDKSVSQIAGESFHEMQDLVFKNWLFQESKSNVDAVGVSNGRKIYDESILCSLELTHQRPMFLII